MIKISHLIAISVSFVFGIWLLYSLYLVMMFVFFGLWVYLAILTAMFLLSCYGWYRLVNWVLSDE